MPSVEAARARKYRSRKQKPCDNCRRRRVCCVRDAEGDCALCSRRSIPCTFGSEPTARRPKADSTAPSTEPSTVPHEGRERETPQTTLAKHRKRSTGVIAEGHYIGLSGTDDVYFVVDRDQAIGNDPAREAYFRERESRSASVFSESSNHRPRPIDPNAAVVQSIFFEQSHPAYPLLDENRARRPNQSRLLTNAIAIISKYTSPELQGLDNNVLIESFSASLLLEARAPSLDTVEAAILFTQRALRGRMSTSAPGMWAVIGTIVGISHDLGLNIDCSAWSIPEPDKRRRKRLWWGVYMQDKWFAMALGRPSYLKDDNITTPMLTSEDFEDTSGGAGNDSVKRPELITGIHCFVAMAELTVILDEILSVFFTVRSVVGLRAVSGDHIIDIFNRIWHKITVWHSTYLAHILTQRFFPDVTGSLEVAYLTVRVMLLRGVFPKLYRRNLPLDRQFELAVETTSSVIHLVETLQINRLGTFWWSCSGFNLALAGTFMASLKLLSSDEKRTGYWDSRLKHYRKLLTAYGTSFWPAKFAASALDHMAMNLTKASAPAGGVAEVADSSVGDGIDSITSPSTPWSGVSYDFFPHNLTNLNEIDFDIDWWAVDNRFPVVGQPDDPGAE
ncbi:hypothetical protein PV04_00191 [Phialophora macrospora]|uniref:Zn(2)-C6 fungal-type domain-containing protein n=1 Tax=Phialophora macrospora TaxID=1851006 RepID=A0A0D2FZR4_9EURO|nr:hypothetical protein PV04_00191 [Phialophora macrospora]